MKRRWIRHRLAAKCAPFSRQWLRFYLNFFLQVRTFARLKVQFAAFRGQARLEGSDRKPSDSEASVAVTLYFKMADTGKANALSEKKQSRIGPRVQQGSRASRAGRLRRCLSACLHHIA